MNDRSSIRDKWTFWLPFSGGTLLRCLKFILALAVLFIKRVGLEEAIEWEIFLFLFSTLSVSALHFWLSVLPSFISIVHLSYVIFLPLLIPSPLFFTWSGSSYIQRHQRCRQLPKVGENIELIEVDRFFLMEFVAPWETSGSYIFWSQDN